eukprot:TRINITY_DN38289_c0_g1_i1.p1 TRINITY_DN38289_c0_g1~~TRINITY_DN38289_c0_g1_i1.p1  ORF type:complete len:535 (+),score=206.14 TRINITY_DN38289_c0_g1_i1:109-1713(+)
MPRVTQTPGETYCLRDVLQGWGVDPARWERMSPKWRCRLAPFSNTEDEILANLGQEMPSILERKYVADVHDACGEDGLSMMLQGEGNVLKRPKLAFNSSWGVPGADLIHESHLTVVHKLSDVFDHPENPTPRNLQMFHRNTPDEPNIPVLPSLFSWPGFLEETSIKCDKATRFSQKNALTTWHLDDCGEFVFQTALKSPVKDTSLIGLDGGAVVKIFFCTPKWAYDMVTQDQDQNRMMKFAQVDLWGERCERLPPSEDLPVITLCLIEAGGRPLLLYPNIPHTVLTVDDSVLVEERRVSTLFLDEVAYFYYRSRQSTQPPIMYSFVTDDCTDASRFERLAANPLMEIASNGDVSETLRRSGLSAASKSGAVKRRAYASLLSALKYDDVFTLSDAGRAKVSALLHAANSSAAAEGNAVLYSEGARALHDDLMSENLRLIPGVSTLPYGVVRHYPTERFMAYCQVDGSPVFGPLRPTLAAATADRKSLFARLEFVSSKDSPEIQQALDELSPVDCPSVAEPAAGDAKTQALLDDLF